MEKLSIATAKLNAARASEDQEYQALIAKFDDKESKLKERLNELNKKKKFDPNRANPDAKDDDLMEINAGGKIVAAKRSVLTQLKGTRLEALFGGRWEKELQRDGHGRIFIDVSSVCFQAIVDYLNELAISSEENPPTPPVVDDDHKTILLQYLDLFGMHKMPDSNIIKIAKDTERLHDWLKEDGSDGDFRLLYRSSRDGLSGESFHSKCDDQGRTLTIIETTDGFVRAVLHNPPNGPIFGCGHDLNVYESTVHLKSGHTYKSGATGRLARNGHRYSIKEMEVFQVSGEYSPAIAVAARGGQTQNETQQLEPVGMFSEKINEAINAKQELLVEAENELLHLEESFNDEQNFISTFAIGDEKDVVVLNVSGTIMAAKRSTLMVVEDSALAQQFDNTKWTEQGCDVLRVKEWTPGDVASWAKNIRGIQEDVSKIFQDHNINGAELVFMDREGLKSLGLNRPGTLCLLLGEIEKLKKSITAIIEHSPYCFGKILDYLRLKRLHSQGLVEEPALPQVRDLQRGRFEKVVRYYFPGDSARLILG